MSDNSKALVVRGEVLPPKELASELLVRANHEHRLVEEALGQALDHVIQAGLALTEVREQFVGPGWEKWVEENFDGGHVVASFYMRIAEYRDLVSGLPNVTQAMKRLQGMPALRAPGHKGYGEEVREEARALARTGMSHLEISHIMGIPRPTITAWIDPKVLQRHRERNREQSRKRREEARRKKVEAERRKAERDAKRVGGALAEAYSLVHKLEAPLARAAREAVDPAVKKELDEAIGFQHMVLYRVVRALGAS